MADTVARLKRLHALRCRLAEAAAAERRQVLQRIHAMERSVAALQEEKALVLHATGGHEEPWSERCARWQLANSLSERSLLDRNELLRAGEEAASAEQAAVQAREQMKSLVQRLEGEVAREQSRSDQARLDDLFVIARVRLAMTTPF